MRYMYSLIIGLLIGFSILELYSLIHWWVLLTLPIFALLGLLGICLPYYLEERKNFKKYNRGAK